jgi:hypothetical protein
MWMPAFDAGVGSGAVGFGVAIVLAPRTLDDCRSFSGEFHRDFCVTYEFDIINLFVIVWFEVEVK